MKIFVFVLALICPMILCGQANIEGKLRDGHQSLSYATVLLLNSDSVFIKGAVSDSTGRFAFDKVAPGDYRISVSMVGYSKYLSGRIDVSDRDIALPEIVMDEIPTLLRAVAVQGGKQLFDQKVDRLIINTGSNITSAGNTILEVLQKSPGVAVNRQNNSISMNGKSGVRVMINDRMMELPTEVVVQMLDGMTASNVERIELITNPPAHYDAQGNAGIIRIVTKEDRDLGTNIAFGLTLGSKWAETLGGNLNLNHRAKRFAYFVDYSFLRNHNLHLLEMGWQSSYNGFPQTVNNNSHRENVTVRHNVDVGFEWQLSENTTINVLFSGYRNHWNLDAVTYDIGRMTSDSTIVTKMKIKESNIWQSATASVGAQRKITAQSEINLSLDYLYYTNDNPSRYDNILTYEQSGVKDFSKIALDKTTPIGFLVGRADYKFNISRFFMGEAGIKGVASALDNNVLVRQQENDTWTTDETFTSYSTLRENVYAAYLSAKWQERQWQVNGGLRYEHTHTRLHSPDEQDFVNRTFGYLFPSIIVRKNVDVEKDYQFSYARRITRPTYNDIAPYVFLWGPNTFSAGNTALYPAISDGITGAYHVKAWTTSLQYSHVENEITSLQPDLDAATHTLTYRSQNLKYLNTIAFVNSYSMRIASWWEVQSHLVGQYQVARTSHLQNNVTLRLYGINVNLVNRLTLPADYAIEISGMYQSRSLSGVSQFLPVGSLNIGIQKNFGEKGILRLSMDDVLYTDYWRITTHSGANNLDSFFNYDWHNQFIRVTYTRSLGNNKLRSVKLRSGSQEERNRVNN